MGNNELSQEIVKNVRYNDGGMRFVLSIIAAHIMVAYNEPESFFKIIFTMSYIRGFVASFVMSFVIINYIYLVTLKLDKKYDWHYHIFIRFIWQVLCGIILPSVLIFLLVTLFFKIYGIDIFKTEYLQQDYPLVLLMLLVVNLYYFGLYHFHIGRTLALERTAAPDIENIVSQPANLQIPAEDQPNYKETIIINTLLETFPINTDDIAYIFRINDGVFIRLKNMKDLNHSYQTSYSLKELETFLNTSKFFRINRQMIVNFQAVASFRPETAKTLSLTLVPELHTPDQEIPVEEQKLAIVSESRTPRFKLWMDR